MPYIITAFAYLAAAFALAPFVGAWIARIGQTYPDPIENNPNQGSDGDSFTMAGEPVFFNGRK